jgi:exosortase E/protease (VPEID-CTERM system)
MWQRGRSNLNGNALTAEAQVFDEGRAGSRPAVLLVWWLGLALLLVAELLALGLRFDTRSLVAQPQWWARAAGVSPVVSAILVAAAAATVICGGAGLKGALGQVVHSPSRSRRWWPCYVLCHLFSLAAFTALTWFILEGEMAAAACPGLWFFAWVTAGMGTLAFWGAAAVPPGLWLPLLRRTYRQILFGAAVGIVACCCGGLTAGLWRPMHGWTFTLVRGLIKLVSLDCYCEPARYVVGTPSFSVSIDKACSGYQGVGLICAFLAFYLWFYRKTLRFPQAMLLVPLGVVAIWLTNVVRIAALILIGTWFSPAVAFGGFHSQAGWLAFNVVAVGLVAIASRSQFFNAATSPTGKATNPSVPYLAPFGVALAVAMVTRLFSSGFDWLYPLRVVAVLGTVWYFRRVYADFSRDWSWPAVGLGALTSILWIILAPKPPLTSAGGLFPSGLADVPISLAAAWWFFRVLGYVIAVPLAEELAFRGYLTRRLIAAQFDELPLGRFSWFSFVVSSVLFGMLHGGYWFVGTLAGMLFALALYHRGRLGDAVLAHATANTLILVYGVATGSSSLWS